MIQRLDILGGYRSYSEMSQNVSGNVARDRPDGGHVREAEDESPSQRHSVVPRSEDHLRASVYLRRRPGNSPIKRLLTGEIFSKIWAMWRE